MNVIWNRITDDWFHSKRAMALFAIAATIAVLGFAFGELGPKQVNVPNALTAQVAVSLVAVMWAFSSLAIIVGMFRYWAKLDRSSRMVRRIWFAVMILGLAGLGFGCAVYCMAVYLPQTLRNLAATEKVIP
jgi:tetrahydromethanopterin S-methyltransferase subunit C